MGADVLDEGSDAGPHPWGGESRTISSPRTSRKNEVIPTVSRVRVPTKPIRSTLIGIYLQDDGPAPYRPNRVGAFRDRPKPWGGDSQAHPSGVTEGSARLPRCTPPFGADVLDPVRPPDTASPSAPYGQRNESPPWRWGFSGPPWLVFVGAREEGQASDRERSSNGVDSPLAADAIARLRSSMASGF